MTAAALYLPEARAFTALSGASLHVCGWVRSWLIAYPGATLTVERFTQAPGRPRTAQNDALEVIGVMRWLACEHRAWFALRGAAEASRAGSHDVLRRLGWYRPKPGDHMNKAAAQVALAYQERDPIGFIHSLTRVVESS